MEAELQGERGEEIRIVVDEHDYESHYALIEDLTRQMLVESLLGQIFPGKLEEIAYEFEVDVPILILFEQSGHEIFVADEFHPRECEVGVEKRIYFVEL